MEIADRIAPHGERAATLRTIYLGLVIQAVFGGSKAASRDADRIARMLLDPED